MKEFLRFTNDSKEFVVFIDNNKYVFKELKGNDYVDVASNTDKSLITKVIKQILPKQIKDLGLMPFNGKMYKHFIDQNFMHIFYEVDDKVLKVPDDNSLRTLNLAFNNMQMYMAINKHDLKKSKFIQRLVNVGAKVITVTLPVLMLWNVMGTDLKVDPNISKESIVVNVEALEADLNKNLDEISMQDEQGTDIIYSIDSKEEQLDYEIKFIEELDNNEVIVDVTTDTSIDVIQSTTDQAISVNTTDTAIDLIEEEPKVTIELIMELIQNNPYLTQEEKDFLASEQLLFEDNCMFYDYETVVDQLSNLQIIYVPDVNDIGGSYTFEGEDKYKIHIYGASDFKSADPRMVLHEVDHSVNKQSLNPLGTAINEAATEENIEEYYGQSAGAYQYSRKHLGLLCEVIEPAIIQQYKAQGDISIIIDALCEIIPDENAALKYISYWDTLHFNEEYEQILDIRTRFTYEYIVYNYIKDCYEAKYGLPYQSSLRMYLGYAYEEAKKDILQNFDLTEEEMQMALETFSYEDNTIDFNSVLLNDNDEIIVSFANYNNGEEIITLEEALNNDIVRIVDGKYYPVIPESCTIMDNGFVKIKIINVEEHTHVLPNNLFYPENSLVRTK